MVRWLLACLLCVVSVGCAQETAARTQLMVVVDTDIRDLERIELLIDGTEREPETFTTALREDGQPLTLALLHEDGPLGPVILSATGFRADRKVVERAAIVNFVKQKTLVVPLHLVRGCEEASCGSSETCTEGGCQSVITPAEVLTAWSGTPPTIIATTLVMDGGVDAEVLMDSTVPDAGAPDATLDAAGALDEGGNPSDAGPLMCSDASTLNITNDKNNCGECGHVCTTTLANSAPACNASTCGSTCSAGYGDCDDAGVNGCEIYIRGDVKNCGACGRRCTGNQVCLWGFCLTPSSS